MVIFIPAAATDMHRYRQDSADHELIFTFSPAGRA